MNTDLEATLNELGPDYRAVVGRLRAGREVAVGGGEEKRREMRDVWDWRGLIAASLLLALGLSIWFLTSQPAPGNRVTQQPRNLATPFGAHEYRMTTDEMIATQRADGSWANDFLTRHNADALKDLDDPRARVAYKTAIRNLRLRHAL